MAHCNTLFHQMLKLIPRHVFDKLESGHSTGRRVRSFTRWSQFVNLMFMQLTSRASLRDGVDSLRAKERNLYHLGSQPVARSTFSDANNRRPASFTGNSSTPSINGLPPRLPSIPSSSKTSSIR